VDGEPPVADGEDRVTVSGATGYGIDRLLLLIEDVIRRFKKHYTLLIPYTEQSALSAMYNSYTVENVDYRDDGILVSVILDERGRGSYGRFIFNDRTDEA